MNRGDLTDEEWEVIDALLRTPVDLGLTDNWSHMIDSATARADGRGRPLGFVLTGGEASDDSAVAALCALDVKRPRLTATSRLTKPVTVWSACSVASNSPDAWQRDTTKPLLHTSPSYNSLQVGFG